MNKFIKIFMVIAFLGLTGATYAQKVTVTGVVTDSLNNPLEMANVVAINNETKGLDGFGITNEKGIYKMNVNENTKYNIKVSYLGYKTREIVLDTKTADITKNFILLDEAESLDGVEITYEMPVSVKGDTIEYNADSFATGTEKKLEDILKNLPGVEVNDDGEIEVEGQSVGKVMVEGKDFFDGDSKLASKNIPANALDKIQVLKNYNEVGQLKGVTDNQDSYAINIKLKEGKKNFWFGEITAGVGNDERYIAHPKLFYYNPNYSINLITNFNNIGEVAFSRRDYFRFTGGFGGGGSSGSGTSFNVGSSDMGFLTVQNNRAKEINSKFGAANFSYSPKKTWDLSGFAIYSGNNTDMQQNTFRQYKSNADGTQPSPDESTESLTNQRSDLALLKLSSSYKPNADNHFDYDIFGRISSQKEVQDLFSTLTGNIDEVQKQDPYSINQNANYYYTLNAKNIFAVEAQYLIQEEDPFYNAALAQSDQFRLDEVLGMDQNQDGFDVVQDKLVKTNKLDAKIDYWYITGDKSNVKFTLGSLLSTQKFNSEIFQILDNGNKFTLDNAVSSVDNDVKYNFSDVYLAFEYRVKAGIFTFTPGVSVHNYTTKNAQLGSTVTDDFVRLLPSFTTRMQLKKSEDINFNYRMTTSFSDVNQFASSFVMNNYNSLFQGNRDLESALSHNLSLRYNNFNMFNFSNIRASVSYNKRVDQVRNISDFLSYANPDFPATSNDEFIETSNRISSPFNSNFADETFSANGSFERTFGKIKGGLGATMNYSKFNQIVNNEQAVNESFTTSYRGSLGTRFLNAPNIEFGYNLSINNYEQPNGSSIKYFTHRPSVKLDASFLKSFIFNADYSYYNYKNEVESLNTYTFMDASLGYQKKDSQWEYILGVTNLFNTKSLNQDSDNTLFVSTSEYFIQPRYVTLKVRYNL
ncbi:carboxypeptidase-like regulatory domain-containing protein [Cellulophaga fucicola]|uniref:carboxypeptidase-like regulatory domain-containing protein n=1 Tax=Cellulophaga fucicola TaxID=76595 RepID=UPI003EB9F85E